jgi:hypothetical protein
LTAFRAIAFAGREGAFFVGLAAFRTLTGAFLVLTAAFLVRAVGFVVLVAFVFFVFFVFKGLAALGLAFGLRITLAVFALRGVRFTVFFTFFLAIATFSSNKSPGMCLTYTRGLTDNRLLSAIPRAATDSPSKLEIRHRAAQEAPKLNE